MRCPVRHSCLFVAGAVLLLSACDPLSFLDQPAAPKAARTAGGRRWTCRQILTPTLFLCEEHSRAVTVALEHIYVVQPKVPTDAPAAVRQLTPARAAALQRDALALVTQQLARAVFLLDPPPGYTERRAVARVVLSNAIDLAELLLDAGLAVIVSNSPRDAPYTYWRAQQRAMQRELGLWATDLPLARRFQIEPRTQFLEGDGFSDSAAKPMSASRGNAGFAEAVEDSARGVRRLVITCDIQTLGPPKLYNLEFAWRALLLQSEFIGPLESFQPGMDPWDTLSFNISGMSRTNVTLTTPPHELVRITRAARQVFTGELISGYELTVSAEGLLVYSNRVTFGRGMILPSMQ